MIKLTENLDYLGKKEIVQKVVSKVIATQREVKVRGYIPVLADGDVGLNVNYSNTGVPTQCGDQPNQSEIGLNAKYSHRGITKRREIDAV